jgi:dihydroxyacetone kinase
MALGGAKPGDKTLVDAFAPFVRVLTDQIDSGAAMPAAWAAAATAAEQAATDTAQLSPRLGRARPLAERSLGHRDAGAVSFALCTRVMSEFWGETNV